MIKSTTLLLALLLCGVLPIHANLLLNGDFETGAIAPAWRAATTGGYQTTITSVSENVHSGVYAAQLGPGIGQISQFVSIVPGHQYLLSFWAKSDVPDPGYTFYLRVSYSGIIDIIGNDIGGPTLSTTYKQFTYLVTPGLESELQFRFQDRGSTGTASGFIDDISFTPVPEASTYLAGLLLLLPLGVQGLRALHRRSANVSRS